MFEGCSSLVSLPDLSKWDFKEVKNIRYTFDGCFNALNVNSKFV